MFISSASSTCPHALPLSPVTSESWPKVLVACQRSGFESSDFLPESCLRHTAQISLSQVGWLYTERGPGTKAHQQLANSPHCFAAYVKSFTWDILHTLNVRSFFLCVFFLGNPYILQKAFKVSSHLAVSVPVLPRRTI